MCRNSLEVCIMPVRMAYRHKSGQEIMETLSNIDLQETCEYVDVL